MSLNDFNGGIGQEVNNRMDVYRNEPQKLQQKAAVSKDLLDLMALQKLKNEKAAAARELSLSMEQDPATIRSQMEREALQMQKQTMGDTVKNVSGALNTKRAKEQKNLRAVAEKGLAGLRKTPQGGVTSAANPMQMAGMGQGITGPAIVKRAQGGIVGFAEGKKVTLSEDQKRRAKQLGLPVESILNMLEDSPEAQLLLGQIGPDSPSSAWSRLTSSPPRNYDIRARKEAALAQRALQDPLQAQVEAKYRPFLSIFKKQSPAQAKFTRDVVRGIDTFDDATLEKLLAVNLNSASFDPSVADLIALPEAASETEAASKTGAASETETSLAPITFESPAPKISATEQLLKDEPELFDLKAVKPETVTTTAQDTAQATLLEGLNAIPPNYDISVPEVAEFKPTDPSKIYDEQGMEIYRSLLQGAANDVGLNVDNSIDAARASADDYLFRDQKRNTYKDQIAREQAFQDRQLDPATVKRLKSMETWAGGGKYGRGGIGQGYLDAQKRFADLESQGLATLRGIDDVAITSDYNLGALGMTAGENAGNRTSNKITNAQNVMSNELLAQRNLSTAIQQANQGVLDAKAKATNDQSRSYFEALMQKLTNNTKINSEILRKETATVERLTNLSISDAEQETEVLFKNATNKIAAAKTTDEYRSEVAKIARLNYKDASDAYNTAVAELEKAKVAAMQTSPLILDLMRKLNNIDDIETVAGAEAARKKIEVYGGLIENYIAGLFAGQFAVLEALKERVNLTSQSAAMGAVDPDDAETVVTEEE